LGEGAAVFLTQRARRKRHRERRGSILQDSWATTALAAIGI
jgi:hypothetical protein